MNFSAALLAVSLAGNAGLFSAVVLRPSLVPPRFRDAFTFGAVSREPPAVRPPPQALHAASSRKLWPLLATDNLPALITRLRAAGFPAAMIRDLIRTEISARYDARLGALADPDPNLPFWKLPPNSFSHRAKQIEETTRLQRERAKLLRELLDDPFFASDETSITQRRQFGKLSREKIGQVQRIDDDYADMISAIRGATNGILLREDREKLAFLTREKRADLTAVLTPEELADYEVRTSPITRLLTYQFGDFRPNEAEFRAIFNVQQQLNEISPAGSGVMIDFEKRRVAQQQLNEKLRVELGAQRFADFMRETSEDFHQLKRLAQRENLAPAVAAQAFDLRNSVAQDSVRIVDDSVLTVEQKRTALAALAQNTRSRLLATLGPVVGPTFVSTVNNQWLNGVESGAAVTFNGAGNRTFGSENVIVSLGSGATFRRLPLLSASPRR